MFGRFGWGAAAIGMALFGGQAQAQDISRPLRPIDPGSWVTNADYPPEARHAEIEGTVGFRLEVNSEGRVSSCTVTQSSESDLLDTTACALLTERATFEPALDAEGNPVAATYSNRFRWQLTDAEEDAFLLVAGTAEVLIKVGADGELSSCIVEGEGPLADEVRDRCSQASDYFGGALTGAPGPLRLRIYTAQTVDGTMPVAPELRPGFHMLMTMSLVATLDEEAEIVSCTMTMQFMVGDPSSLPCQDDSGGISFERPEGSEDDPVPPNFASIMVMSTDIDIAAMMEAEGALEE